MRILVIDVGGTHVKLFASGATEKRQFPSGAGFTPQQLVEQTRTHAAGWAFDVITIGIPSPVLRGAVMEEPWNLGTGWVGFDFAAAFGKPVRVLNDAAMQALGSDEGGRMLFLGLGSVSELRSWTRPYRRPRAGASSLPRSNVRGHRRPARSGGDGRSGVERSGVRHVRTAS